MAAPHTHHHLHHQTEPLTRVGPTAGQGRLFGDLGRRSFSVPAAILAFALCLSACGSETTPGSLGTDTVPVTIAPPTTPPPETTTTIDFNVPNDQVTTPLSEESTAAEVAEVSDNIRGLTIDSTAQLNRLAPFVNLISARTAKIVDFSISVTRLEVDKYESTITMSALAPNGSAALAGNLDDELRANGWNRAVQESQTVEAGERLTRAYRTPGTRADDLELTIVVTDGAGATGLELMYVTTDDENDDVFDRVAAWQDAVPVPRGAVAVEASLATADDEGSLSVVYEVAAESIAEARAVMLGRLSGGAYELALDNDESEGSTEPLRIVDEEGTKIEITFANSTTAETVDMTVNTAFDLAPVE